MSRRNTHAKFRPVPDIPSTRNMPAATACQYGAQHDKCCADHQVSATCALQHCPSRPSTQYSPADDKSVSTRSVVPPRLHQRCKSRCRLFTRSSQAATMPSSTHRDGLVGDHPDSARADADAFSLGHPRHGRTGHAESVAEGRKSRC